MPAKATSLALQWLQLHPSFGYRRTQEYGREPCPESQVSCAVFFCAVLYLWWCPSIACMKYAQRAHTHCTLRRHGTRSTSGVRHLPQSSGDGGLRAGCRERRNSLTRCAPWPKVIRCPEPHPNEGLDRPTMPAGMTDEAWIMEALLSHSVPRDFHA